MDPLSLRKLNAARRERRAAMLVTDLGDGRDRVIGEGDTVAGALGEAVAAAFRSGRSQMVEADGRAVFLNVHMPPPRIVVIGAVHISQALAPMARIAGFDVEVIDPRTAFATPERFAGVRLQAALAADCFYVGALGSRKTHARRVERFLAQGVATADIDRIHAPIGLDIGAATPAEIAVAVLAQIVQALRSRGLAGQAGRTVA